MAEMICNWFYQNAAAIIISSMISLLISMMYYRKGNRDELLMSIIFPVVQLLDKRYSKKTYEELFALKSNYAIRYLRKKERKVLMLLIEQYRVVCRYSKSEADTDCILSYFDFKLSESGINPKPCPIYDDEGEVVADDYPPDYFHFADYIYNIVSRMEFEISLEEAEKNIIASFKKHVKTYYTDKEINWFKDYSIEEVIQKSQISQKWKDNFQLMEERKKQFMDLSISKKVQKILRG